MNRSESLSIAIVEAIADAEGVDATDLEFSLGSYVDTDALDAFVRGTDADWQVRLTVAGHTVTVGSQQPLSVDGDAYPGAVGTAVPAE